MAIITKPPRPITPKARLGAPTSLMTATEVADMLRMPKPTVYYLTGRGTLPSIRIGRRIRYHQHQILEIVSGDTWGGSPAVAPLNELVPKVPDAELVPHEPDMQRAAAKAPKMPHSGHRLAIFLGWDCGDELAFGWMDWCLSHRWLPLMVTTPAEVRESANRACLVVINGSCLIANAKPPLWWVELAKRADAVFVACSDKTLSTLGGTLLEVCPVMFCSKRMTRSQAAALQTMIPGIILRKDEVETPSPNRANDGIGNNAAAQGYYSAQAYA